MNKYMVIIMNNQNHNYHLLNIYYVSSASPSSLHALCHYLGFQHSEASIIISV